MKDFFLENTRETVEVEFVIGIHTNAAGDTTISVHEMEVVDGKELAELADELRRAGKGKSGDAKQREATDALYRVWNRLVVAVRNYGTADEMTTKEELLRYFRGDMLPVDLDERKRKRAIDGMRIHVLTAVNEFFNRYSGDKRFR